MAHRTRSRITAGTIAAGAAGGLLTAGLVAQQRLRRRLARDPEYASLTAPLGGRPMSVRSADGTRLHAEAFGPADGSLIVLAHGWTEQLTFWGPVIRRLVAHDLRVVAYDLRGHGRSGRAIGHDYALARFGEDLRAVVDAALVDAATVNEGRATVAGHSLGAMSIAAWAEHDDISTRAWAAALVNTGMGDLTAGSLLLGELGKRLLGDPRAGRAFLGSRAPVPPFASPLSELAIRYIAFGPTASSASVAFYERMLIACPPDVRAACGVALSEMDLWHALARLTVPTLVLAGGRDRLTPPAHAHRMARELPALTELLELPETGHMSPLERPDEVSAALLALAMTAQAPLNDAHPLIAEPTLAPARPDEADDDPGL